MADPDVQGRPRTSVPHLNTSKAQEWRLNADLPIHSTKAIPMSPGRIRPNRVSSIGVPMYNSNPTHFENGNSSTSLRAPQTTTNTFPNSQHGEQLPQEMTAMLKTLKKMEWAPPGGHVRVSAVSSSMMGKLSADPGPHNTTISHSSRPSTAEPSLQAPFLSTEDIEAMSKALVGAEKQMELERKHSNEMIREMRTVLAEGHQKFEAKKEKRRSKEVENLKRLEAGKAVIEQMTESVAEMKTRQAQNHKIHTDAVKLAERALMDSVSQGGSADMQRLKTQLDVEQVEMARLEQEESDMKARFSALRQEVLDRLEGNNHAEDAMRRIDMQERVANERMSMKRTRHVKAMELLKTQLLGNQMDLSEEARATAKRLKEQQAQTESMEQAFQVWEASMNLKLEEARKGVEILKKKIDDDRSKWDMQTLPSLELQMQRAEKEMDARMQERARLERNMSRALDAMKHALGCAEKAVKDSSNSESAPAVLACRTFLDEAKQFWTCQRHRNMLGTATPRSSSSNCGSSANSPRDHAPNTHDPSFKTVATTTSIPTADAPSHPPVARRSSSTFRRRSELVNISLASVGTSNTPAGEGNTPEEESAAKAMTDVRHEDGIEEAQTRPSLGSSLNHDATVEPAGDARALAEKGDGDESAQDAKSAMVSVREYAAMLAAREADERKPEVLLPDSVHVPPNPDLTDQQYSATSADCADLSRNLSKSIVDIPKLTSSSGSASSSDPKDKTESTAAPNEVAPLIYGDHGHVETSSTTNEVASSLRSKETADLNIQDDSTSSIASTAGQLPVSSKVVSATNDSFSNASHLEMEDSESESDEEALDTADKAMSDLLVKNWTPFRSKIKTQSGLALRRAMAAKPPPISPEAHDAPIQRSTSSHSDTDPLPNQPSQSLLVSKKVDSSVKKPRNPLALISMELRTNVSASITKSLSPSSKVAISDTATNQPNTKATMRTNLEPLPELTAGSRPREVGVESPPKADSIKQPRESDPPASRSIDTHSVSSSSASLAKDLAGRAESSGVSPPRTSDVGSDARLKGAGSSEAALDVKGGESGKQDAIPEPRTATRQLEPAPSQDDAKVPKTRKGGMGTALSDMKEQGQAQDETENPLVDKTPACYSFNRPPKGAAWQESPVGESAMASGTGSDSKSSQTSSSTRSTTNKLPSQGTTPQARVKETKQEVAERRARELQAYRAEAVARERLRAKAKEASDRETSERKQSFERLRATSLEADRLKHEQEEMNRKAILEQQRLREEAHRRTREQEALQAERERRRREEMVHQQREQHKLEQERLRRMAQERVAEATRQREELRQKEAQQQHKAGSAPAGGWQRSAAAAEEAATRRRNSEYFGQSSKPEAQQPGTKKDWWERMRTAAFFARDTQPKQNAPPKSARQAGNEGGPGTSAHGGNAPTGGNGGSRPGSAAPGSAQSRYARAAASSRPSSATLYDSQRRSAMSEYDQLKEKVAAQLRAKYGSMDVCAAMSALGVPVSATGNTDSDIRKTYKRAALKFHPDRNRQEDLVTRVHAEEAWMLITTKYDLHFAGR